MRNITNEQIIEASKNTNSATEAADLLGINYKTYKKYSKQLGCFKTNQSGKGISKSRVHSINENAFDILNEETAYWIGFLAADGSVTEHTLSIKVARRDRDILEKIKNFLNTDAEIKDYMSRYRDKYNSIKYFEASSILVHSINIVTALNKYGIVRNKKYKDISFISNIPDKLKMSFIIGFFDGDGSISCSDSNKYKIRNYCATITSNHALNRDIQCELNKLGIKYYNNVKSKVSVISISNQESMLKLVNYYKEHANKLYTLDRKLKTILECEENILNRRKARQNNERISDISVISEKTESCKQCGKPISKQSKTGLCNSCANVKAKGKSPKPSKEELEFLLKQGLQKKQIAEQYDRSPGTVQYWIDSYGLYEYKNKCNKSGVTCVELNIHFNTFKEAAEYLVSYNVIMTKDIWNMAYQISKAKQLQHKYHGYTWI